MKKLILMTILVALMAAPAFAGATFSFSSEAQVLSFNIIADYTTDTDNSNFATTTSNAVYGSPTYTLGGDVGLLADGVGESPLNGGMHYIGVGLSSVDLTGFTTYSVMIYNDDNTDWDYKLFADDGTTANKDISGSWTSIAAYGSQLLTLNLSNAISASSRIGIMVGSGVNENTIHTSVTVPAPGAMILGGIGVSFVGWLRRRRSL